MRWSAPTQTMESSTSRRGAACLVCVLEHIDQRLLDLHAIEPARPLGQGLNAGKALLSSKIRDELPPGHGLGSRRGQFGKRGIAADELVQVLGALRNRREDGRQRRIIPAPRDFGAGVRERG